MRWFLASVTRLQQPIKHKNYSEVVDFTVTLMCHTLSCTRGRFSLLCDMNRRCRWTCMDHMGHDQPIYSLVWLVKIWFIYLTFLCVNHIILLLLNRERDLDLPKNVDMTPLYWIMLMKNYVYNVLRSF